VKKKLQIPDTGVTPPPYCPACLDHWRSPTPIRPLHDSCRAALTAIKNGTEERAA
jgi:hypothetical protein